MGISLIKLIKRSNEKMSNKKTDNLYYDSEFGLWLEKIPGNVGCTYSEFAVDNGGTRVTVTFYIDDEE